MRFLRSNKLFVCVLTCIVLAAAGCSPVYKNLQKGTGNADCIYQFRPAFTSTLYNTHVNVVGKHLSGLLLFKRMPDSSMRIVFSSEMGAKFFDFEFNADGAFKVHQVMSQLNKKAVIKTLRNDFELILMLGVRPGEAVVKTDGLYNWYGFPKKNDTYYYVTTRNCDSLVKIEHAMKRKPKVQMIMSGYKDGVPDTIGISHRNFNFDIGLKFIPR